MKYLLKKQITKYIISFFLVLIILQPILVYADQSTGSIEIDVKYTNRDRADYSSMTLKVYQDFNTVPYKEISSLSANPYNIVSLPIGHKYKVEVYANGMYSSTDYVDLQSNHEVLDTTIPLPGGIRFSVFYNDGSTPIENAIVSVKSQDGKQWTQSPTDNIGQTTRFWIQPPIIDTNYYITDVSIGKNLFYSFSPVKLKVGVSQELKIITPWPTMIHTLVTAKVFKDLNKTVTSSDGSFLVELYDDRGNKITDSQVNSRGQAYFSNLKFGDYVFHAKNLKDNSDWGSISITIDGNQNIVQIFKSQPVITISEQTSNVTINQPKPSNASNNQVSQVPNATKTTTPSNIPNCQCLSFRLDNIQDYWLNNVQTKIIDTFQQKNASMTIGIIGNAFDNDVKLTGYLKDKIKIDKPSIEIANNGWKFEDFSTYSQSEQSSLIKQSNDKISTALGIKPSVFIPPYGKINNDTFVAMNENKMNLLSANTLTYHTIFSSSDTIHRYPATVASGFVNTGNGTLHRLTTGEIFTNIQNSLHDYGFAVVTISFQDYAMNNGTAQNEPDPQQIQDLETLIDKVRNSGMKILTIKEINKEESPILIPSWIKNNAVWWTNGQISDSDFISGIQYMIQNNIIIIQNLPQIRESGDQVIPSWIKDNAGAWAENKISDSDFVKGIEFLVQHGIIRT
ncbi:polysaccharide deacetylase family protein [Candidatus Pacearchaeota archaeon]|nr:polysaccharide deacetylase family protein [Candidatus Pacearchaeota archaeon]